MKIASLKIENFRGIRSISLQDLGDMIVVAGANGSGKSCIFDAIRLLKSAYGGYQPNEWHHWMGEFQVNFQNDPASLATLFQNRNRPLSIEVEFVLHADERKYIMDHAEDLVRQSVWRVIAPEMYGWSNYRAAPMAAFYRDREQEVGGKTQEQLGALKQELAAERLKGHIFVHPGDVLKLNLSKALEIVFSNYLPSELGLIDYHGAQRMYTREQVSGINLNLEAQGDQLKQHALYNYTNKYANVKSEMAGSYIKELLAAKAGVPFEEQNALSSTLDELFATFFPDKKFLGPQPTADGRLEFPVRMADGSVHDLNELSAGEKEVLYGYLRIRNSAPRYSVILLDEPELHLNPRLIRGLPNFYHRHLGKALDNQIWLVTHSDALLREVVGRPEYAVYHMTPAATSKDAQLKPLNIGEDLERAVINLIGDLASYLPGGRVVLFEGGGDSDFDQLMTSELFPELVKCANLISGGNKRRVRDLHEVLDVASKQGKIPFRVYSITDQDSDQTVAGSHQFIWDAYHIENYLLEPRYIRQVMRDISGVGNLTTEQQIEEQLRQAAKRTMPRLVQHEMGSEIHRKLVGAIQTKTDPHRADTATAMAEAIHRSLDRLNSLRGSELTDASLATQEHDLTERFEEHLANGSWKKTFRGRQVLTDFVAKHLPKVRYEVFRNLIISRMRDDAFRPLGMQTVISRIVE